MGKNSAQIEQLCIQLPKYRLRTIYMNKIKFLLLFLVLVIVIPGIVFAQEKNEETNEGAVEQIREAVTDKVRERIEGVTSRKVGIVGTIDQIQEATLGLAANAEEFVVLTNEETSYSRVPGSSSLDREEIELSEYAIVMGSVSSEEKNTISANVIQLIEEPVAPARELIFGKLIEVNRNGLTLNTTDNLEWVISFTRSTDIFSKSGAELEELTYSDLEEGDLIIAAGIPDEEEDAEMDGLIVLKIPTDEE